jgi:hypothetical protein
MKSPFVDNEVGAGFSPAILFSASEPGMWLDPSDLTTMFQDIAGSIPVTAPDQPVGLRLDKSKGLVRGPEFVPDPNFDNAALWIVPTGWGVSGGVATATSVTSGSRVEIAAGLRPTVAVGSVAEVVVVVDSVTAGAFTITFAGTLGPLITAPGTYVCRVSAAGTAGSLGVRATGTTSGVISYLSARLIEGNHAAANNAGSEGRYGVEPVGGRRNLMLWTEGLTNAVWTNVNVTVAAPDTQGWIRLEATTSASTNFYQVVAGAGSASGNTFTVQVKKGSGANDANRFFFRNDTTATTLISIQFNYDTGAVSGTTGVSDVTVTAGANAGEWTLKFTPSSGISAGDTLRFYPVFAGAPDTAGEFAFLRNMQLEAGAVSTPYQRVTTQFDVTEAGVPSTHYVNYDGTDSYLTQTVTPGTDKVQVFAGIRRFTDPVANGMIIELSPSVSSSEGSFYLIANTTQGYTFASRGTTARTASSASTAAPVSDVLTGLGDISGDIADIRDNGVSVQDIGNQGTGNFLAYPMYIGRRSGSLIPFTGRDYGLIVRFGPNLSASTISSVEAWLGVKTGFTAPVISGVPTIGVS